MRTPKLIALLAGVLLLANCGTPSPPQCRTLPRASRVDPALTLQEAKSAWQTAARSGDPQAIASYNTAVAKLFDRLRCGEGTLHDRAAAMGCVFDESRSLGAGIRLQDLDALVPASEVSTKAIGDRHVEHGMGLPVVGWKKTAEEGKPRWEFEPPTGVPLNLTALLRFPAGKPPEWSFAYPGRVRDVEAGKRKLPLAADWSAPSALYWQMSDLDDLDMEKVFLPSRFSDETALYVVAPYDPKKIPLVMVHGLNSSPGTFKRLYNELNREPWFRQNYQVWFYSYPTGNNWLYSAALFRLAMVKADRYAKKHGPTDKWEQMVVIGHSMGGVITHASLKKPGDAFFKAFHQRPLEKVTDNKDMREAIRLLTMYEPLEPPDRVIFMAAPHRGSPMADRFFSTVIRHMIRLPKKLTIDLVAVTLNDLGSLATDGEVSPEGWFTSIGSLSPSYPAYKALGEVPFRDRLAIHSVIGDRGRGDTPKSSDGIVPYWSSHLDRVESECIVPYNHSVPACPQAAVEVKRILKHHLKGGPRPTPSRRGD
jgi:pimeloyl-ACP methyl ester carboxylesterase